MVGVRLAALFGCVAIAWGVTAQTTAPPANLDFETATPGGAPAGWFLPPQSPGIAVALTADGPRHGERALLLTREPAASASASVNVWQQFDAQPYRGRRIRFRMAIKTDMSSQAQMWLRIEGASPETGRGGTAPARGRGAGTAAGRGATPAGRGRAAAPAPAAPAPTVPPPVLFLDNMDDRPISRPDWGEYEIVADVPATAGRIALGVFALGAGHTWADDAVFENLGRSETRAPEGPRPLTRRAVLNLLAFTRLLGAVRYFHPSDQAASADWDGLAVNGMRAVEAAPDAATLVEQLDTLFKPVAPAVIIAPSGSLSSAPTPPPAGRLIAWRHLGLGTPTAPAVYRSERVTASEAASLDIELGGGVVARVPLTVAADASGTLPRDPAPATPAPALPAPTRQRFDVADRAVRLAVIALAWNAPEHFYPYFDVVRNDWAAALRTALQEAATDTDAREFTGTLRRLTAALHDGQARVVGPRDADGRFVPPVALGWVEEKLTITGADAATGLAAGDVVIAVDGTPAPLALEAIEPFVSGATPAAVRERSLRELLEGARDSQLTLRVDRVSAPGTPADVALTRTVAGAYTAPALHDVIAEIEPGILYVDLTRIGEAQFNAALGRLGTAKGLVFDLRGYPGGMGPDALFAHLTEKPVTSPQWQVPQVQRPDREAMSFVRTGEWIVQPRAPYLAARKAFLADSRSIGYTESCLSLVTAFRLGDVVGSTTAGTNGDTTRVPLPGDFTLFFTTTKVLSQSGAPLHGVGIRPTIAAAPTRAALAAGRDEVLERAVQAVK